MRSVRDDAVDRGTICATRTHGIRLACLALLAAAAVAVMPSVALADGCPSADVSYNGNCGPTFAVPNWTDAGGWTDPSKYSTIQLADLNGDGTDELIGRNDEGLEFWTFDTTVGQWRPQVDANDFPQVLTDFASPVTSDESDPHAPTLPWYYSTIQAADIDGQPGAEILARFWDGMRVYKYLPPSGGTAINGGTWKKIGTAGPFSDAEDYGNGSLYPTIHVAQPTAGSPPVLYARQHSSPGQPSLVFYTWQNGGWTKLSNPRQAITGFSDQECGQPSCYLNLQTVNLGWPGFGQEVLGRNGSGASAFAGTPSAGWTDILPRANLPFFADVAGTFDCPFSAEGASGPGSGDCLGSSPSYYETLRAAPVFGSNNRNLIARASDGLRLRWNDGQRFYDGGALPALGGAASAVQPGQWGSIRTGNVDGSGGDEVLALDGTALQAWSWQGEWVQLQPSTPLALGADPWLTDPEYYSTIQTGDVDGDGSDDVIARGPYGIRTWFYNRRGTGGWERYLPTGYPAWATTGQQNAYSALNTLATTTDKIIPGTAITVRGVWSAETPPAPTDLTQLQSDLVRIAGCTGQAPANPPSYATCTPPSGSTTFTAADWTTVVNQLLAENYAALQVVNFFAQLDGLRTNLFINEGAELPAIGDKLGLSVASGSSASWNTPQLWSLIAGVAGSLAGTVCPPCGAALSIAAYALSAVPSASPTAMGTFNTTYGGLQDEFAQMATEVDKTLGDQSQAVRSDAGLLGLVGDLRASGTWDLDLIGMQSAANQAFAIWVYRTLMPTVYDRYYVYDCQPSDSAGTCTGPPNGPGVIPNTEEAPGWEFTTIGPREVVVPGPKVPCSTAFWSGDFTCTYDTAPADIMTRIWGSLAQRPDCDYVPGTSTTAWTFDCPAAVDVNSSIGANTWGFNSHEGGPYPSDEKASAAQAAAAGPARPPIALGRSRVGRARPVRAGATLSTLASIPRRVGLAGKTLILDRLLFERSGHGELTRPRRSPPPWRVKLRRTGSGRFTAATTGTTRTRVTLQRVGRRDRVAVKLAVGASTFRTPRACHALPASVALKTAPHWLETRLRVRAGRSEYPVRLSQQLRCRRDARGNVNRLVPVRDRRFTARPGLAVTVRGPDRVQPGARALYVARVSNRRGRRASRLTSSLWDVTVKGAGRRLRIRELRPGRSRQLAFTVRVPRDVRGRYCGDAVATAAGARPARTRTCAPVRAAAPPRVTG